MNGCLKKINAEDIRQFEDSTFAKCAVKLLWEAIAHRPLTKQEFTTVRDYLLATAFYENATRPGPLENAKLDWFQQAEFREAKNHRAKVVDEHSSSGYCGDHNRPVPLCIHEIVSHTFVLALSPVAKSTSS